jgi:hypothetical protein
VKSGKRRGFSELKAFMTVEWRLLCQLRRDCKSMSSVHVDIATAKPKNFTARD